MIYYGFITSPEAAQKRPPPDTTHINHSMAYGGRNVIKLGIYVEFINSMCWSQFWLIPIALFEIGRDDTWYVMNVSRSYKEALSHVV